MSNSQDEDNTFAHKDSFLMSYYEAGVPVCTHTIELETLYIGNILALDCAHTETLRSLVTCFQPLAHKLYKHNRFVTESYIIFLNNMVIISVFVIRLTASLLQRCYTDASHS